MLDPILQSYERRQTYNPLGMCDDPWTEQQAIDWLAADFERHLNRIIEIQKPMPIAVSFRVKGIYNTPHFVEEAQTAWKNYVANGAPVPKWIADNCADVTIGGRKL